MGSHHSSDSHSNIQVLPRDAQKVKQILKVTYILAFVTAVEFVCAAFIHRGAALTSWFVLLTFVKTYYIVGDFMHLKHEVKTLITAIVLPVLFLLWFIFAMLFEGNSVFEFRQWIFG